MNKLLIKILLATNSISLGYFVITQKYPWYFLAINVVSVIIGWFYVFTKQKAVRVDLYISAALIILGLVLYTYRIEEITPGMWNDEIITAQESERLVKEKNFVPFSQVNYGHATPLLYATGYSIKILGRSLFSIRLISILFAAFNTGLIYILLKQFCCRWQAVVGTVIFATLYPNLIVSRFAYEMSAALFFQILSMIFLYQYNKKLEVSKLIGLGLSLGGGFFTYLGFRSFALLFIVFTFILIRKQKSKMLYVLIPLIITSQTLVSFAIHYPAAVNARAKSVSVFHQGLPTKEVFRELGGNLSNIGGMFINQGDPNNRQNPSNTIPFDHVTLVLSLLGLTIYFYRSKTMFMAILSLIGVSLANDIFTLEKIPEFHVYGLGHPNTLRIFGLIPLFSLLAIQGLTFIYHQLKKKDVKLALGTLTLLILLIVGTNLNRYFNQPITQYNYFINGVPSIRVAKIINTSDAMQISLSSTFKADSRVIYFTQSDPRMAQFTATQSAFTINDIPSHQTVIIDPKANILYAKDILTKAPQYSNELRFEPLISPFNTIDAMILERK